MLEYRLSGRYGDAVRHLAIIVLLAGCGASRHLSGPPPESVRAYTEATLAAQAGEHARAAELYDEAAAADPTAPDTWLAAARARLHLGQMDAAAERAERARALDPSHHRVLIFLARLDLARGELSDARARYAQLTERHPEQAVHWRELGEVAERQNDLDAAERAYGEATRRAPTDAVSWERLGTVLRRRNRPAAAASAYDQAIRHDPSRAALNPQVLSLALAGGDHALARVAAQRIAGRNASPGAGSLAVARLLLERQDLLAAANELEFLLDEHPEDGRARLMLGQILGRVGRFDEAEAHLRRIPVSGALGPDALHLRSQLALARDDVPKAISLLEQARRRRPERARYAVDHARALRAAGRNEEALTLLTQGINRWPRHADLRFVRAMTMHDLGDVDGAVWAMHEVLDVAADHPGALNYIGFTWAEEGKKLPEAERMIRAALRHRPEDPAIIDSLGWVLYKQAEFGAARQALERAVSLDPEAGEIRLHLAACLWKLGERDAARAALAEALDKADPKTKDALQARWRRLTAEEP